MFIGTNLGVEIAGKDLRFAAVRAAFGKLRLSQSLEIAGFSDLAPEAGKASLEKFIKAHKLSPSRVFLALPGDRGIVRQIEFPEAIQEDMRSAVALQLEALCPWPIEEVYWDYAMAGVKSGAKTVTATIVIIPRSNLDPWIDLFRSVKLPLSGASLSSVCCAHGVISLWPETGSMIVLNCEPGSVEGSFVHGDRLASVRQTGDEATASARTVVEQLLSIGRVQSPEETRLLACGSSVASLEGSAPTPLPLENARHDSSDRFGAIAAALTAIRKTPFDCNLIPRDLRHRRNQLQLIPTYALIALTILLGLAMMARGPYQSMVYAAKIDSEIQKVAPEVREVSTQEAELNGLSEKYRVLESHFQKRDLNLEALRELSQALPSTAWLLNYTYQEGVVTISGTAVSASEVQKALEDNPLFKDVQFTSSVARDANGKDRFTLKALLEVRR